ncbi:MAG: hypothetical protein ACO1RX_14560 [Candidatus Sericytochromatia bacterium]
MRSVLAEAGRYIWQEICVRSSIFKQGFAAYSVDDGAYLDDLDIGDTVKAAKGLSVSYNCVLDKAVMRTPKQILTSDDLSCLRELGYTVRRHQSRLGQSPAQADGL